MPTMKTLTINDVTYDIKDDNVAFLTDKGNSGYRGGLRYSGTPTAPAYVAVWDVDNTAGADEPNRVVRGATAETVRELIGVAPATHSSNGCYWRTVDNDTEWINSSMSMNIEYRTTERYNGSIVYAKWLYFGKLPNSSYASVAVGDSCTSCTKVISVDFYAVNSSEWCSFPIISSYGIVAYHWITPDGYLAMNTDSDFSGYEGYALIKYIE